MSTEVNILDIMEKTIETLQSNKETIIMIIKDLQEDYEQKKKELDEIKSKLPEVMLETARIKKLDKQLRQELVTASNDFSSAGHAHLKHIFTQASHIHDKLFKMESIEQDYIKRRDKLELELKKAKYNIEKAETMAHQLMTSLSYLKVGIVNLNSQSEQEAKAASDALYTPALTAFKCIENEKSRIARDLHDGPMQRIASVQMRIDFCKTAINLDLEKGLSLLENLKKDLSFTLSEVRGILFDLNPAPLEKLGLKACIEYIVNNIFEDYQIAIHFDYQLDDVELDFSMQNTIYRILQELLNNIKKHAEATSIKLELRAAHRFVYIILEDNGVGFPVPEDFELFRTQNKSYGLSNIYTRIQNLNGHLKASSTLNTGSCFKIELPILSPEGA